MRSCCRGWRTPCPATAHRLRAALLPGARPGVGTAVVVMSAAAGHGRLVEVLAAHYPRDVDLGAACCASTVSSCTRRRGRTTPRHSLLVHPLTTTGPAYPVYARA